MVAGAIVDGGGAVTLAMFVLAVVVIVSFIPATRLEDPHRVWPLRQPSSTFSVIAALVQLIATMALVMLAIVQWAVSS